MRLKDGHDAAVREGGGLDALAGWLGLTIVSATGCAIVSAPGPPRTKPEKTAIPPLDSPGDLGYIRRYLSRMGAVQHPSVLLYAL